jgi:hypothetical protein
MQPLAFIGVNIENNFFVISTERFTDLGKLSLLKDLVYVEIDDPNT